VKPIEEVLGVRVEVELEAAHRSIDNRSKGECHLDCYYKRYTPLLDGHRALDDKIGTTLCYRVNNGVTFLAFADLEKQIGGFARDLIIDYARLSYSKGYIVQLTRRPLGFWPFPNKTNPDAVRYVGELVGWHREKIKATCDRTKDLLSRWPSPEELGNKTAIQDT
jgi:hypothetical protein